MWPPAEVYIVQVVARLWMCLQKSVKLMEKQEKILAKCEQILYFKTE